jgi:hypothetical protein
LIGRSVRTKSLQLTGTNDGKVAIEDKNRAYYQGPILKNKLILSDEHVLDMSFEASDMAGVYQIQMTFHETISKRNFSTAAEIELVKFKKPESFASEEELSEWTMNYYQHPDPIRSFASILYLVKTSSEWLEDNSMSLAFYRRIFLDNPFLWENYAKLYKSSPDEDKEKMLLVAAGVPANEEKGEFLKTVQGDMKTFYDKACKITIPSTEQKITTAVQLDILWAEFFASGTYQPVKQIVSALGLKKHRGMLEVVGRSAEWSLISNCLQSHRAYQYCQTVYERETLDPDVKESLGVILATVEIKKREQETTGKKGPPK